MSGGAGGKTKMVASGSSLSTFRDVSLVQDGTDVWRDLLKRVYSIQRNTGKGQEPIFGGWLGCAKERKAANILRGTH